MNTPSKTLEVRAKALLLTLPFLAICSSVGSWLIMSQGPEHLAEAYLFIASSIVLVAIWFHVYLRGTHTLPIAVLTQLLITGLILSRITNLYTSGLLSSPDGPQSEFVSIYAALPIVYLTAYMLLPMKAALLWSLFSWLLECVLVFGLTQDQLFSGNWNEGLDHILMVVYIEQPVFIAMLAAVPPYAAALQRAKHEAASFQEALEGMEEIASADALTGLYNRRFLKLFWKKFLVASDEPVPLTLCLIDIDHFKQYNDSAGHLAGDECLKAIAGALKEMAQILDAHCVRYGGEEFLFLSSGSDPLSAKTLAEAICNKISSLKLPHPARWRKYVSVSVGATEGTNHSCSDQATWLRSADEGLYAAKAAGRNRFRVTELPST